MAEYNPIKEDAAKAEAIRRRYMEKGTTKLDQLQALDAKVKTPALAVASILGIIGCLILGTGMSNIMVWDNLTRWHCCWEFRDLWSWPLSGRFTRRF